MHFVIHKQLWVPFIVWLVTKRHLSCKLAAEQSCDIGTTRGFNWVHIFGRLCHSSCIIKHQSKFFRTDDEIVKLINFYEANQCLWDCRSAHYRIKEKEEESNKRMLQHFGKVTTNADHSYIAVSACPITFRLLVVPYIVDQNEGKGVIYHEQWLREIAVLSANLAFR